ncbi:MAG TPA: sigma-70 family RNA polymerase sigma factor [Gemmataceae bacterium]|nr:sigma-70 family RNA polymerase sigma factor [Gemmataceae bacterium]
MSSDDRGLLDILEQHGAQLHALLTRLTLRAGVAEDLLQELFLKLRAANGFGRSANRKAYAFRAAIHLAFDWRRRQRSTEPLGTELAGGMVAPLDRLIDAEDLERVLDAVEHLSDLARQTMVLRYLQQLDYADIAEQLGKTEHQVRGLCFKALHQLRTRLRPTTRESDAQGTES